MTSNQEQQQPPPQQHVVYQQAYATGYQQPGGISVWNQPPTQAVYAIPYQQGDMGSYADKASYAGYPPLAYAVTDSSGTQHYQQQQFPQANQWQYHQQAQSQFVPSYANQFNVANDPAYQTPHPNMNRPPPHNLKRDGFHGTIGMMENPAQSAAAYTANWVSCTSSIPPDIEENDVNVGQWDTRGGQVNQPYTDDASKNDRNGQRRNDRVTTARELTFDERLEKARMQKDRVENQGDASNGGTSGAPVQNTIRGGGRGGVGGGGRGRGRRDNFRIEGEVRQDGGNTAGYQGRGRRGGNIQSSLGMMPSNIPFVQHPVFAPQGQYMFSNPMTPGIVDPNILATLQSFQNVHIGGYPFRRGSVLPGPFGMPLNPPIQQDAKFRNTWLDAQNCPLPFPIFGLDNRRGGYRGRGRGGYSTRGGHRKFERRDENAAGERLNKSNVENGEQTDEGSSSQKDEHAEEQKVEETGNEEDVCDEGNETGDSDGDDDESDVEEGTTEGNVQQQEDKSNVQAENSDNAKKPDEDADEKSEEENRRQIGTPV